MEHSSLYAKRAAIILSLLRKHYPDSKTALHSRTPFQLLCAVILSAQCTDVRVNEVTPQLFKHYGTPEKMARATLKQIEHIIFPTGFYKVKAAYLKTTATTLVSSYGSKIPHTMEELITLPGVGRKTANVVLSAVFNKQEGIAVDTHVQRIARRWQLTKQHTPEKIEQELMQIIPQQYWGFFSWATILHGRSTCFARKPACTPCVFNKVCPSAFQFSKVSK